MPTNFELKRLKPKLDIVKKPENRVHELTDSNVSHIKELFKTAKDSRPLAIYLALVTRRGWGACVLTGGKR